jgi:hypothetical protein
LDSVGNSSASSPAWIEGTGSNDTFAFGSEAALIGPAQIAGNGGVDTISFASAVALIDGDFAHVKGVQDLALSGASSVALGSVAQGAGINTVITGTGATSVADTGATVLTVNAAALANSTLLTLSGSSNEAVTGLVGDVDAHALSGTLSVAAASTSPDHSIAIKTGTSRTTVTDNDSADTVTIDGSALADNTLLSLAGSAAEVLNNSIGDVSASGLSGSLTVNIANANSQSYDHSVSIVTGSGTTKVSDNSSADTVNVTVTGADTVMLSGSASFVVKSGTGANQITGTGGTGRDTFVYSATTNSTPAAHDTISAFSTASDQLNFAAIAGLNNSIESVAVNFLTSTPTSIAAHSIDVISSGGNTILYANASSATESISRNREDMQINLSGVTLSSANISNFILR